MNDTDELVPELMRRATERLDQPDAADLVDRGLRRGKQLQRRRTIGISIAAAAAVVLAASGAFAARTFLPSNDLQVADAPKPPAAQAPVPTSEPSPKPTDKLSNLPTGLPTPLGARVRLEISEKEAIEILRSLVPEEYKIDQPKTWGDEGFTGARITVNDGMGGSELAMTIAPASLVPDCPTTSTACTVLPDGTVVESNETVREYSIGHPSDLGVVYNTVHVVHPNGYDVSFTSYNAVAEKGSPTTRKSPPFSVDDLVAMAKSERLRTNTPTPGN